MLGDVWTTVLFTVTSILLRNPTLYSFSTGEVVGSFENNSVLAPSAEYANGCSFFNFEGKEFFVYPNNPIWMNESDGKYYGGPYDFSITEIGAKQDFSTLERLWIVPNGGLGNVYSFYGDVLADYETQTGITGKAEGVNIYFYIPSNGLAAYNLRTTVQSGLADSLTYNFDAKIHQRKCLYEYGWRYCCLQCFWYMCQIC